VLQVIDMKNIAKRVFFNTVVPPKNTLTENDSSMITSPKWRASIDEQHDSHARISLPSNQRSSDDLHQILINAIHRNSYQDEPISSLIRKHHLSRLSLHSISYDFGLGKRTRQTIDNQKKIQQENISYRLPSNKIELDKNQQEIIRRSGSLKKNI
jgi:hypothetical protein